MTALGDDATEYGPVNCTTSLQSSDFTSEVTARPDEGREVGGKGVNTLDLRL